MNTFSEFISKRELLRNKRKQIFIVHIKHYWHFDGVTPKLTLLESYWQAILHTFPEFISSNTDIFRGFLPPLTKGKTFLRVRITQYWHFQRIFTYLELLSNSIHTFTELIPSRSKNFFESFNGHLNRQKVLEEKSVKS